MYWRALALNKTDSAGYSSKNLLYASKARELCTYSVYDQGYNNKECKFEDIPKMMADWCAAGIFECSQQDNWPKIKWAAQLRGLDLASERVLGYSEDENLGPCLRISGR